MPRIRGSTSVLFLSGFSVMVSMSAVLASFELSPEMMADKKLIKAELHHEKQEYADALKLMDEIIALQTAHNFKFSDEFHYKYARMALSAGSAGIAIESIGRYLAATGREGKFYKDALALLIEAEERQIRVEETRFAVEETCTGKPQGFVCWKELANLPQCYIWDDYYYEDQTVTWSGGRYGSVAHGKGTLVWTRGDETYSQTGHLQKGKKQGQWVGRGSGYTSEGPFMDGKRHGVWVTTWDNGDKERGEYVAGKQEGRWLVFTSWRAPGNRCRSMILRSGNRVGDSNKVRDSMCDF